MVRPFRVVVLTLLTVFAQANAQTPPQDENGADETRSAQSERLAERLYRDEADPEDCGDEETTCRIVGGVLASANTYPWIAALIIDDRRTGKTSLCGGTLIAQRWLLTAAHCFFNRYDERIDDAGVQVQVGGAPLYSSPFIKVDEVITHEDYDPNGKEFDIALVKLERDSGGQPIALSDSPASDPVFPPGASARALGYGETSYGGDISYALREVTLPVIDNGYCAAKMTTIYDSNICAGYELGGKDSCKGDSGGPLIVADSANQYYQIGIISWGKRCAEKGKYGVYSRVSSYTDWINGHVAGANRFSGARRSAELVVQDAVSSLLAGLEMRIAARDKGAVTVSIAPRSSVRIGENVKLTIETAFAGHLVAIDINSQGEITQLYPNQYLGDGEFKVEAGTHAIPGANARYDFQIAEPLGASKVVVMVFEGELELTEFVEQFDELDESPVNRALYLEEQRYAVDQRTASPVIAPHDQRDAQPDGSSDDSDDEAYRSIRIVPRAPDDKRWSFDVLDYEVLP
ncbi:MAG: trypsin-like serine protease [Pseudomonadota bacterium]